MRYESQADVKAFEELYLELVQKYKNLNFSDDYFEMNYIDEYTWLSRHAKLWKSEKIILRDMIDHGIEKLCKMEADLLKL